MGFVPNEKQVALQDILSEIIEKGDYEGALLSDNNGLPIAQVATHQMIDMMAAITAVLKKSAEQAREHLDLAYVNELSLVGDDRFRLVCRFFTLDNGHPLSLTVVVPPDQAYRRITNQAIRAIIEAWAE